MGLAYALGSAGTELLFGVPGGGSNLDVVGACEAAGIRFVLTHTETAAAIMAGVTAGLTGTVGACVVTRGPGVASAINGIAQALLDRQPVIIVTDCVADTDYDRISHQRIDQHALMSAVTKGSFRLLPTDAKAAATAVALTQQCRPGPVHVELDASTNFATVSGGKADLAVGDFHILKEVLSSSKRPVIVLGVGATSLPSKQRAPFAKALKDLLRDSHIPVLTTYNARGVVDDLGPHAAGVATGATIESQLLHDADAVIGIGFDPVELIPHSWSYSAPVVLLGSWVIDDSTYFGDRLVGEFVGDLARLMKRLALVIRSDWEPGHASDYRINSIRAINEALPEVDTETGLTPQQVVNLAAAAAPGETVIAIDAGAHMLVAVPLWPARVPGQILISSGLATMGFALPAAVAASLVTPTKHVICFTGDGGIGMALAELETLARLNAKVVVVVFNDSKLSLIAIKQRAEGHGGSNAVTYTRTDFAAIAAGYGCNMRAERAATIEEYNNALKRAFDHDGPTLLDVQVDPGAYPHILEAIRGQRSNGPTRPTRRPADIIGNLRR